MERVKKVIIFSLILLWTLPSMACEYGKTYMDYNLNGDGSSPSKIEIEFMLSADRDYPFYIDDKKIWHFKQFDQNGKLEITTEYSWWGKHSPLKGECPYVLYKGHRWYPQYHGIVYVYEDGKER